MGGKDEAKASELAAVILPNWRRWSRRVAQAAREDDPGEVFWVHVARLTVAALEAAATQKSPTP